MGGVVSAVTSVVSDAVEAVGNAVEDVGQFVVDDIVEPVAHAVENTVQSIEKDPIGSVAKIAAVATGQFELLPLISAADTLAHGGSLEQAALNAGVAYVAGEVGGEFADYADSGLAGGAAAGATSAAIKGGDVTQGALSGVINSGINQGISGGFNDSCVPVECAPADTSTDTEDLIPATGSGALGCASTQDQGGLPTVVEPTNIQTGQQDVCADQNCADTNENCTTDTEQCLPDNEDVKITGGDQECCADCTEVCSADECGSDCCAEACGECCSEDGGSNFKNPFKLKFKKQKTPRIKTPKTRGVKITGGKGGAGGACAPVKIGGLGSVGITDLCQALEGCNMVPWLDSRPDVLKSNLHVDKKGNLVFDNKTNPKDLYDRMDQCLASEFQDRFGGVPQVNITPGGALGGNYAEQSGYASGGCVAGCSYCMNQNPKYFPKFIQCGPDGLQTTGPTKRQPIAPKQLKQLAQQIASHGNMGGLAAGGLPKRYHEAAPKGHNPEFVTGLTGYYACGGGTGQSDDIKAMLHDGDYVMDADVVAALGDGSSKAGKTVLEGFLKQVPHRDGASGKPVPANIADGEYVFPAGFVTALGGGDNKAGAKILDGLREKLRAHKRSAPTSKIPPKAKSPLDYIKQTKG